MLLTGRHTETAWLADTVDDALAGRGGLVLLSGEAGVGKTQLAEAVLPAAVLLRGAASPPGAAAYGPVVAALRSRLRRDPSAFDACGPLRAHLARLLPELGAAAAESDQATLFEAVCGAFEAVAPAVLLLDDLQWSDGATLDLLAALAAPLREMRVLVVGVYRSDELSRVHPLRRLRADLRRGRVLRELVVAPLDAAATAALAAEVLGEPLSDALAETLYERTHGVPFFVVELAGALRDGLETVPETIRDAVLLRTAGLSPVGRAAAEAAAVAGLEFPVDFVPGLDELLETGLAVETEPGRAAFRHSLVRSALYEEIAWLRRTELHAWLAESLSEAGAPSAEIAGHWLAATNRDRARDAFFAATFELAAVHAHRDAARAGLQALELWPEDERPAERLVALDVYAHAAELAGDLGEAARALREAVAARRGDDAGAARAATLRRLASLYELQGDRERALAARADAAASFAAAGLWGEAATERLLVSGYRSSAGLHGEAAELAVVAADEAALARRPDLRARALGLEGVSRARRGEFAAGVATVRSGLSLALDERLTVEAAELYQRLATSLECSADYDGARTALSSAVDLCEASGAAGQEHICLSCMAYVLRELGEWDEAAELCRDLDVRAATRDDAVVPEGVLGSILGFRGDARAAGPLLARSRAVAVRLSIVSMEIDTAAALGWIAAHAGDLSDAGAHFRTVLARWERSEELHYAVWGLRTAAWVFAAGEDLGRARETVEALSAIAATSGHQNDLSALAYGLAEVALAEGEPDAAAAQFARALELQCELETPFERAQIAWRTGVAFAAAGSRAEACEQLTEAYRVARGLGSRPVAAAAAASLAGLGESVEARLGRRAAAEHSTAGLSRRELEVMRYVSSGHTNREIADLLVLSPRTVDMHVRNILAKLSCRTRTEAASRAAALGLV